MKNNHNFSPVFEIANQLLVRHSLYLAPWMNGNAFSLSNVNWMFNSLRSIARYRGEHSKRNVISPRAHLLISIYLTNFMYLKWELKQNFHCMILAVMIELWEKTAHYVNDGCLETRLYFIFDNPGARETPQDAKTEWVDFDEGGNRSTRRKPWKSGWDQLKNSAHIQHLQ